jgi:hypothetical protein
MYSKLELTYKEKNKRAIKLKNKNVQVQKVKKENDLPGANP